MIEYSPSVDSQSECPELAHVAKWLPCAIVPSVRSLTHISLEKWAPFRRRYFQTHFRELEVFHFYSNFTEGPIGNKPVLVKIMAWRRTRIGPLSEPMLTHICKHHVSTQLNGLYVVHNVGGIDNSVTQLLPGV